MQYRRFGQLDWRVSALGFGCARFPTVDDKPYSPQIREEEAIAMLHYAIDHGVNYVDTAYGYHDGNSEPLVGRALQGGYREKVRLATKSPLWQIERGEDFDKCLAEQLQKLQTDCVDFYLLHALDAKNWQKVTQLDLLSRAERAMAGGRIRYLGFSFHDEFEVFQEIVDGYGKWTFCQFIYNFLDAEKEAGTHGLKYAASTGLAIVVMEPVQGGKIAQPPPAVQEVWNRTAGGRTPSALALQWVWDHPEVAVALSGMGTMQQVEQNIASAERSRIDGITPDELALLDRVREAYRSLPQ